MLHHDFNQLFEGGCLRVPSQLGLRLGGVTPEVHHVGGTVEVFADSHNHLAVGHVDTLLVHAFTLPAQFDAGMVEGEGGKLSHRMLHTGSDDEVFWSLVL